MWECWTQATALKMRFLTKVTVWIVLPGAPQEFHVPGLESNRPSAQA